MSKLFEAIEQERPYCPDNDYDIGYNNGLVMAQAIVLKRDIVEVVRCKDCKYREKSPWDGGYRCGNPNYGMASAVDLKDEDFCSYGERKDNE